MTYDKTSAREHDLEGLLHAAQVRVEELEAERDQLEIKCDYQDELIAERDGLQAQCAACPDLGMAALVERLQAEQGELLRRLAEANEKARLQLAIDRIRAAGYDFKILYEQRTHNQEYLVVLHEYLRGPMVWAGRKGQWAYALNQLAEKAAEWAEAERVEAVSLAPMWQEMNFCYEEEIAAAMYVIDYLRDHNHIREAE